MQKDITISVGGTAVIIAFLFWLAHRRVKPMLWLLALLVLILGSTLALGGLIFGSINVLSIGFAAILLGLAVDYAVVHYQEALANPALTIPQIRHGIAPSILWAAVTTIAAFLVLNFGGLPGLAQLGTLVAVGVALAASIMVFEFLPPLFPERNRDSVSPPPIAPARTPGIAQVENNLRLRFLVARFFTGLLVVSATLFLCVAGFPKMDSTAGPLRPRNSTAYAQLEKLQKQFTSRAEPLWVIVGGKNETEVASELAATETTLQRAVSNNIIESYLVPSAIWPRPSAQASNRPAVLQLLNRQHELLSAAVDAGFAPRALALTEKIFETWRVAADSNGPFWPTNPMSAWILEKVTARTGTNCFALALIQSQQGLDPAAKRRAYAALAHDLNAPNRWLTGWELLGDSIFSRVKANYYKVLAPMVCLVLISLWFAFKRLTEILLSVAVLSLSALCLLAFMHIAGWSWNLLNLMAIPLILGTGVDYSIFMLLGLRRYDGNLRMTYNSVARALLLCGGTAIAGFGSLALSSNAGMASLGAVCAVGIAGNMIIAIFLLPHWWLATSAGIQTRQTRAEGPLTLPNRPSSLYAATSWKAGLFLARLLPAAVAYRLSRVLFAAYRVTARHRREVVLQNLLPVVQEEALASGVTKRVYDNFAIKIVDLLRYEAGMSVDALLGEPKGWEHFVRAREQKTGVLLVTPHLGNWEFGAPYLTRKGLELQVITLAEPAAGLTELRQAARARRKIRTLVIGEDPFAFVEVIRRLEGGATVALLIDRPPGPTGVTVNLFGRPFLASIAAAELARAANCAILPAYVPRCGQSYEAEILPAIEYDRASLRDRQARQELTQRIMNALEPAIREHLDQWYHFVPVWGVRSAPTTPGV